MGAFFSAILAKISAFASWLLQVITAIFIDVWEIIVDGVCYVVDTLLTWVTELLAGFDVSAIVDVHGYWQMLPPTVLQVLGAIGIIPASAILVTAILIRLALQLIPFVRLGS